MVNQWRPIEVFDGKIRESDGRLMERRWEIVGICMQSENTCS